MSIGGRERIVATLCTHAPDDGIEPFIIGYDRPHPDCLLIQSNAPYIQLDRRSVNFCRQLSNALSERKIDIVHAQGHIPAYLLNNSGAFQGPKIVTTHIGMQGTWRWLPQIRSGLRHMDRIFAVSKPMAHLYRRISGRNVDVIPNGIALSSYLHTNVHAPRPGQAFCFIMLSRLDPIKRHQDAIKCMDRLIAAGYNAKLTIAGDGENFELLKRLARSRPYINIVGAVSDVRHLFSEQHAFIICSDCEGMPMALIEAMATGLPVVASAVGGIPDMLGDSIELVTPRDIQSLYKAMAKLIDDSPHWNAASCLSKRKSTNFDSTKMAASYRDIYHELAR